MDIGALGVLCVLLGGSYSDYASYQVESLDRTGKMAGKGDYTTGHGEAKQNAG